METAMHNNPAAFEACWNGIIAFALLGAGASTPTKQVLVLMAIGLLSGMAYVTAPSSGRRALSWAVLWLAFGLLWIVAFPTPAKAQNAPTFRSPPVAWSRDVDPHWHAARHERRVRRVWRAEAVRGRECQPPLAVVGDQYATENGAREEADKAWMQTARWMHGERYMDRAHADDATYECGRSSVGSVAGQTFTRCRLVARPCRADRKGDR